MGTGVGEKKIHVFLCVHLVDAPVLRQVEAVLRRRESLHLLDARGDGHGGQVDLGVGLFEAQRGVHGRERDPAVPWERQARRTAEREVGARARRSCSGCFGSE